MDSNLDVQGLLARDLAESARAVASALERTDEWAIFREAAKALDEVGKANLRATRKHLTDLLAPEAVDAHEPDLMLPRDEYRTHMTSNAINSLEGTARSYADAFTAANNLIEVCASEIFGQLAMYGNPISLPATQLSLHGGTPTRVSFEIPETYVLTVDCGNVTWLHEPLVSDAVKIESLSTRVNATGEARLEIEATILDNTGNAWNDTSHEAST
ncbi:hypothetical protein [Actinopolyspora erythraea]|uniref:hypothetical protein n=1 Tax=Actinopolyspora erythraea TaxID=414996 RepID=UPI0012FD3F37|nr:hypothetical protein [Actinopolyspora erythraea]